MAGLCTTIRGDIHGYDEFQTGWPEFDTDLGNERQHHIDVHADYTCPG